MNIKIGEKIKLLRRRDGRKQEELANALGVTPQAISRWEANGGYPDLELLPSIANYFNVSIDELFGYSKERESKLKNILDKADKALNKQGDMTECIEMLREAAEEFPTEPNVLVKLGYALSVQGWKKCGAKSYTKEDSQYTQNDTEYNSANIYWQEEIKIFEKVLDMDINIDDRDAIIMMLTIVYNQMGYIDKAKALAKKQSSIIMCRELLLSKACEADERAKYQGEAVIALLTELKNLLLFSIGNDTALSRTTVGKELVLELAGFYECVFSDGCCGIAHTHLMDLYIYAAMLESRADSNYSSDSDSGDTEKAYEYFCKAFEHYKLYNTIHRSGEYEYKYTSPLVSKVTFPSKNFPEVLANHWNTWMTYLPTKLKERIKANPEFAECFN